MHDASFTRFVASVRDEVEAQMTPWIDARVSDARRRGADVGVVADAVGQLTLRGGKRMRAALLVAAYDAFALDDAAGRARIAMPACLALELFQTYLLIHDDFMDGDELRRGGPSVPALMRARFGEARGPAMSVLAGDLASAWAQAALASIEAEPARVLAASRALAASHERVVEGQVLDVAGEARHPAEVEAMHALKTASYTVVAPVHMGAQLAGATAAQIDALGAFAAPLGVAFQLRDDVLGTFGVATETGKPSGNDLREGKRTALVVDALADASAAPLVERVLGQRDAADADVQAAAARIDACGARARVESRIADLAAAARAALEHPALAAIAPVPRALLSHAAGVLTERRS